MTWRLDHSTVLDNDGNPVAIIADPDGPGHGERIDWPWMYTEEAPPASFETAEDNANLIAAAPDLLAAVELALFAVTKDADTNNGKVDRHAVAEAMRAAIAKAKGE